MTVVENTLTAPSSKSHPTPTARGGEESSDRLPITRMSPRKTEEEVKEELKEEVKERARGMQRGSCRKHNFVFNSLTS